MDHLQIIITPEGKEPVTVLDTDVVEAAVDLRHNIQEVRSDPRMAAVLAGAPLERWMDLPGEQVATMHYDSDIEVIYVVRFRAPGSGLSEFQEVR